MHKSKFILVLILLIFSFLGVQAQDEKETCTDSDGGYQIFEKGTVVEIKDDKGNKLVFEDLCVDSRVLKEYVCLISRRTGRKKASEAELPCEFGCEDGKCRRELLPDPSRCTETDGGNDPNNSGTLTTKIKTPTDTEITLTDLCLNDEQLLEYYCSVPDPIDPEMRAYSTTTYFCANGCSDGKCLPPKQTSLDTPVIKSVSLSKTSVFIDESFTTQAFLGIASEGGICKVFINSTGIDDSLYAGDPTNGCHEALIPKNYLNEELEITQAGNYSVDWHFFPPGCDSSTLPCFSSHKATLTVTTPIDGLTSSGGTTTGGITSSNLENVLSDLNGLLEEILSKAETESVRPLVLIGGKIKRVIDLIETALELSGEGDIDSCGIKLAKALRVLDVAISQLELRQCKGLKINTRRCIPKNIAQGFLPELEDLFDLLDEENSIDSDDDGIPDACGLIE